MKTATEILEQVYDVGYFGGGGKEEIINIALKELRELVPAGSSKEMLGVYADGRNDFRKKMLKILGAKKSN